MNKLTESQILKLNEIRNKLDSIHSSALQTDTCTVTADELHSLCKELDKLNSEINGIRPLIPTKRFQVIMMLCNPVNGTNFFIFVDEADSYFEAQCLMHKRFGPSLKYSGDRISILDTEFKHPDENQGRYGRGNCSRN